MLLFHLREREREESIAMDRASGFCAALGHRPHPKPRRFYQGSGGTGCPLGGAGTVPLLSGVWMCLGLAVGSSRGSGGRSQSRDKALCPRSSPNSHRAHQGWERPRGSNLIRTSSRSQKKRQKIPSQVSGCLNAHQSSSWWMSGDKFCFSVGRAP